MRNVYVFYEGTGAGLGLHGTAIGFGVAIPAGIYALTEPAEGAGGSVVISMSATDQLPARPGHPLR